MNIALVVMKLFPNAQPMIDFLVQDDSDGRGAYIAEWNLTDPQPTEEELQSAWDSYTPTPEPPTLEQQLSELQDVVNMILGGM